MTEFQLKNLSNAKVLCPNHFFSLAKKIHLASRFHLILDLNIMSMAGRCIDGMKVKAVGDMLSWQQGASI